MSFKNTLLNHCYSLIQERVDVIQNALKNAQEAANQETKSSAGDKYETGRAMMHLEKEKLTGQMSEVLKMKQALDQINSNKDYEKAELGALVRTKMASYFLSASVGKLEIDGQTIFAISPAAPIGQAMLGKQAGEEFSFSGRAMQILELS